jgi:flavin reductase ActVB
MPVTAEHFRKALGAFPSGVVIVTGADRAGNAAGATVSAFTSLSLDPPLVLAALDRASRTLVAIREREAFVAHVVSRGHEDLAYRFATSSADKFSGSAFHLNERGVPVLDDCGIRLECRLFAEYPGGDHAIVVGEVEHIGMDGSSVTPVAWHDRSFRQLARSVELDALGVEGHDLSSWLVQGGHNPAQ